MSPVDGRHPPAHLPRCSCYQAEACCAAGSLGSRGAPRSRHIDQRQPWVAGSQHGVRCKAIHIMGFGARRFRSLEPSCRKWSGAASGHHCWTAQWPGPIRSHNSADNTSLRVVAPPGTMGSIKGRVMEPLVSFLPVVPACRSCPSFLLVVPAHRSCQLVLSGLGSTVRPFPCWLRLLYQFAC